MLSSTFYFKNILCPFAKSGSCNRPYCHFKHDKSRGELFENCDFIVKGHVQYMIFLYKASLRINTSMYVADLGNAVQATREFIAKHSSLPGCIVRPQTSTSLR